MYTYIYLFFSSSCFAGLFLSSSLSHYSFSRPPQHDRPSFSLTHGISLPRLFIAILLSSSIQSGGLSPYPFFLLFVLTHTSPLLSAFIGLRCPAAAIVESGSLTFTSGDKYGFVQGIPGFQRRAEFSIPIRHRAILYDCDLFGANLPECAAFHK